MGFKVGDRVRYTGSIKYLLGRSGVITRKCPMLGTACVMVKMPDIREQHMYIKYLKLNQKNQQLLFDFME